MTTILNHSHGPDVLPQPPKQIRFVNNQGQPPTKRRRINAACLTCRRRKTRCSGEHPTCSTCTRNGHACLGYSDGGFEKKKDAGDSHGSNGVDMIHIDGDDEYMDEESENDRGYSKDRKSGPKAQGPIAADDAPSSRRLSEPVSDYTASTSTMQLKSENIDWNDRHSQHSSQQPTPRGEPPVRQPPHPRHLSFSTEDGRSHTSQSPIQHHSESVRVPYFRYFGPTAIVPGFKQMVVKVRDRRRSSMSATSPSTGSIYAGLLNTMQPDHELGHIDEIPFYDPSDTGPVHPLILNLVDTFFVRLGSNYPFLRRDRFRSLVQEKRIEPILVDAVCALAARFTDVPILQKWNDGKLAQSEYGHAYAQRAKAATVDTFPAPSVAAVQACLLMAYDGFGADQDSMLWMYLGIAIRMAIDLGLPRLDGVKYRGAQDAIRWYFRHTGDEENHASGDEETLSPEEQKAVEQERIDTFWAVFFLDRVISAGTGRTVTLKDDDFELELPKSSIHPTSGWPDPTASLLRIIHLNGRVFDVLNYTRAPEDFTIDKMDKLAQLENELTKLHQKMEQKLRFDANNFQAHVKNGQGTTFILLHLWFHAIIILLHQPTILTNSGPIDRKHQLKPHSRELVMSSAKTIVDILAFAELLDPQCINGNPFTSQPIYIAACAFLLETPTNPSQPGSRSTSPSRNYTQHTRAAPATSGANASSRHHLLASAADHNYQLCYKALKQMHAYWGGVRYILTALDQRVQGKTDIETYTLEEYESTKRSRRESVVRRLAKGFDFQASPMPENGPPLGWSLTGTTNSPNSSLTLLFQNPVGGNNLIPPPHQQDHHHHHHQQQQVTQQTSAPTSAPTPPGNMIYDPIRQSLPEATTMFPPAYPQANTSALRHSVAHPRRVSASVNSGQGKPHLRYEGLGSTADDTVKGPSTPDGKPPLAGYPTQTSTSSSSTSYTPSSQHSSGYDPASGTYATGASPTSTQGQTFGTGSTSTPGGGGGGGFSAEGGPSNFAQSGSGLASSGYSYLGPPSTGDLHLLTYDNETDIGHHLAHFEPNEMISWFGEYFPNDVLGLYTGDSNIG